MIEALVDSHESSNAESEKLQVKDVVQGKGRGLVLLLHGPPGVGKTLTAETIATATVGIDISIVPLSPGHVQCQLAKTTSLTFLLPRENHFSSSA